VRIQCPLSVPALVNSTLRPQLWGNTDAAEFSTLTGKTLEFAQALVERLERATDDVWRRQTLIGTVAQLPEVRCSQTYAEALASPLKSARLLAMIAIARHCPGATLGVLWDKAQSAFVLNFARNGRPATRVVLDPKLEQDRRAIQYLVERRPTGLTA